MAFDKRGNTPPHRWRLWVMVAATVLVLALVVVVAASVGAVGGINFARQQSTPAANSAAAVPAKPAVADDIKDLVAKYGEPADAKFARLRIPKLGVDAGVSPRMVTGADMPLPDGPENVAWYDMSRWPGLGGRPGEGRNAIFGAHVDFNNRVNYANKHFFGPAIFYNLDQLAPGDVVEVVYQGKTLKYQVTWTKQVDTAVADWASIWNGSMKKDSITLFTCGGVFNAATHEYSQRLIVRAERA